MSFTEGELVRCDTSNGPWVGEVVTVSAGTLTVKCFSDNRSYQVPAQNAKPFSQFLAEQRRSRKLKTVYAEFFGGPPLERMPQKRLEALRQVLREHGVAFDESVTRADGFLKKWTNQAHLTSRERKELTPEAVLPEAITAWLPHWVVADPLPPSSRDPLGLQADAGKLADALLPGLTVFTNRVGYFFFLCWAIRELNQLPRQDASERHELLNRLERALVLCETLYHGKDDLKRCFHQGHRAKTRLLAEVTTTAKIPIPDRILKNQNSTGCYNLYRTAMRSCGFWEDDDEASLSGQLPFRLTARGEKLAGMFSRRNGAAELLRWVQGGTSQQNLKTLQQWGQSLCFLTFNKQTEKKAFLEGFLFAQDDRPEVVNEADTRLRTLGTLANAGLLFQNLPPSTVTTLVSPETAGADIAELTDNPDWGDNAACLLHFYRHRSVSGATPFVAAAVYELLGLALNAIFCGLIESVIQQGRISMAVWQETIIRQSAIPQFWDASVSEAAAIIQVTEEQLVTQLFDEELPVESGLIRVDPIVKTRKVKFKVP